METNFISRTFTGLIAIIVGIFLCGVALYEEIWVLLYGVPITILGIFILTNKKEDSIEEIKKVTKKK